MYLMIVACVFITLLICLIVRIMKHEVEKLMSEDSVLMKARADSAMAQQKFETIDLEKIN